MSTIDDEFLVDGPGAADVAAAQQALARADAIHEMERQQGLLRGDRGRGAIDVRVAGRDVDPWAVPICEHKAFLQDVVVARIVDDDDRFVALRAQVRVKCGECGVQMRFVDGPAIYSADRCTLGAMIEPSPE